jgi:hypothetical protein
MSGEYGIKRPSSIVVYQASWLNAKAAGVFRYIRRANSSANTICIRISEHKTELRVNTSLANKQVSRGLTTATLPSGSVRSWLYEPFCAAGNATSESERRATSVSTVARSRFSATRSFSNSALSRTARAKEPRSDASNREGFSVALCDYLICSSNFRSRPNHRSAQTRGTVWPGLKSNPRTKIRSQERLHIRC